MKPEILTAVIAACVAVVSAVISIYGQIRVTQFEDRLAKQREAESREAQTAALMSKYRDPILRSAIDLQSRLFNIDQLNFFPLFYQASPSERDYTIYNTLYVIAEYFGWVEILRREVQFLDVGDLELNRRLGALLVDVVQTFSTSQLEPTLRLFHGEQRAIGELMIVPTAGEQTARYDCLGYATFVQKMDDPEFARWFSRIKQDLERLAEQPESGRVRIRLLQNTLIDLIDFLDPHYVRIPAHYRTKILPQEEKEVG